MLTRIRWMQPVFVLLSSLLLTGCLATVKEANTIISNLTKTLDTASTVDMMAYVAEGANMNVLGESVPVSFMVIQMKNDQSLFTASFEDLSGNIKTVLKNDYLSHEKYTLAAGKFIHIGPFEVNKKTLHIAVVSSYKELEQKIWRVSKEINPKNQYYSAHVTIGDNGVKLDIKKTKKGLIKE